MTVENEPRDQAAREQALDPGKSFIVQAPAGSGKTGLLTQRYLRLLGMVDNPEEIIAITFTRKAAGEMRDRVLAALVSAGQDVPPSATHQRQTWQLAREALRQDRSREWRLLENPSRLRIQTIDSLCQSLTRQTPLLSRFGSVPGITEDARPHYREAAKAVLQELESGSELADAIEHLLRHRDNRMDELQSLIAAMLARRDQWLRHVAPHAMNGEDPRQRRTQIESVLARLVEEALARADAAMPAATRATLPALADFAAGYAGEDSPVSDCRGMMKMPGCRSSDLPQWLGIVHLLLTKNQQPQWRRTVDKRIGFPPESAGKSPEQKALFANRKQAMQALLDSVNEMDTLQQCLAALTYLPGPHYSDDEWQLLDDLFRLLVYSALHLQVVFGQRGEVDFIEMAMSADLALGSEDEPTDLTLRLDYQIRHMLVDEFQDTSQNQYTLFRKLIAGWTPGDGRTLFLVGDPMQSIYRFREAEVGLFLQAWEGRIGNVPLEPLTLSVNFRSQQGIIDWVNQAFPQILPADNDKVRGAVTYTRSDPYQPRLTGNAVTVHAMLDDDPVNEAERVLAIIDQARQEDPDGSIAILVRSKIHVADIVQRLKRQGQNYQAVEIDKLAQRPVISDLLALSCALLHAGDRINWLAVLRAPWCGLTLADLYTLAGGDRHAAVIDQLMDAGNVARLSQDGTRRLARVLPILQTALAQRGRHDLRAWIEGTWIALGGPACVDTDTDSEDAEVYFQLLEQLDGVGNTVGPEQLHEKVTGLFALPDIHAGDDLQIMTMHKAKGLEFDTVILPGLGRMTRSDESRLLYWLERTGNTGEPEIVFGPIRSVRETKNRIVEYIKRLDREKDLFESGRLLYVAATRARRHLHLLGQVTTDRETGLPREPASTSLLSAFWPVVRDVFEARAGTTGDAAAGEAGDNEAGSTPSRCRRLASDWVCPPPPEAVLAGEEEAQAEQEFDLEFDWASESARLVGTVVHRLLEQVGRQGIDTMQAVDLDRLATIGQRMLVQESLPGEALADAADKVREALESTFGDERGRWILSASHRDVHSEYALTSAIGDEIVHMIIDRTFVDAEGTRWIIDYKTGSHAGGGLDEFLDREQARYRNQLEEYATAMRARDDRPVRLGLYFPLLKSWREWKYEG